MFKVTINALSDHPQVFFYDGDLVSMGKEKQHLISKAQRPQKERDSVSEVCTGRAGCFINCLFSPFILLWHAIRVSIRFTHLR